MAPPSQKEEVPSNRNTSKKSAIRENYSSSEIDLLKAAEVGDLTKLKYWVEEKGVNINYRTSPLDDTPVLAAIRYGQLDAVKYLLEKKAELKLSDKPLHLAAQNGQVDVLKYLVEEKGFDINANITEGDTLLHMAAEKGNLNVVKYLIEEKKADVNARRDKPSDTTPLYLAAKSGNLDLIKYLLQKGADINATISGSGRHPLHVAAQLGKLDVVKFFVENKGIDVNIKTVEGDTPLIMAVKGGNYLDTVKYLVGERKANVNVKNSQDASALKIAAEKGLLDVVKYLIVEGKADLNEKQDILQIATENGSLDVVKYLLEEKGTDKTVMNFQGDTLLHLAAGLGGKKPDIAKYLVSQHKMNVNAKNRDGDTPLHLAAWWDRLDTVKYLVSEGKANLNAKNNQDETPLAVARRKNNTAVVQYLQNPGTSRSRRDVSATTDNSVNGFKPIGNSASKPSLFIGSFVFWLRSSITGFLLPTTSQAKMSVVYPEVSSSLVDGFLILLDIGIRKFSGNNYRQSVHESLLLPEELLLRRIDPVAVSVISGGAMSTLELQDRSVGQPSDHLHGNIRKNVCIRNNVSSTFEYAKLPFLSTNID